MPAARPDDQGNADRAGPTVSFVVPALNEEGNIADTVSEIRKAAEGHVRQFEVLLIDDASTDRTGEIMAELASSDSRVKVIHNQRNLGLGGSYKAGVAAARYDYVIMVPGDNNHPAEGIVPILEKAGEADIVIPYVTNRGVRSPLRRFFSTGFVWLLNFLFRQNVRYYNGIVLHRSALLRTIRIQTDSFAYQAEAILKLLRRGATYVEVGVKIAEHGEKQSTAFRLRNVVKTCLAILHLVGTVYLTPRRRRET